MNAATSAVVRTAIYYGLEAFGIMRGYAGMIDNDIVPLHSRSVANIIQRGGTILKTARCKEFFLPEKANGIIVISPVYTGVFIGRMFGNNISYSSNRRCICLHIAGKVLGCLGAKPAKSGE